MGAVDFLFPPSVQRVLGLVFSRPEQEFTLKDLLVRAGAGNGNSQRHIEQLIQAGVLEEGPRRGRQRAIKANTTHFLYPELRAIALKSFALVEPLREALAPFADRIDEAFIFGSVAGGSDSHRSDIDLIVIGSASLLDLTQSLADVEIQLGRAVHLAVYTAKEWMDLSKNDPILAQISESSKLTVLPHGTPT